MFGNLTERIVIFQKQGTYRVINLIYSTHDVEYTLIGDFQSGLTKIISSYRSKTEADATFDQMCADAVQKENYKPIFDEKIEYPF